MDFTGNLNSKHFEHSPFILIAVDSNSRWPVAKICKNTNHESVITFLKEHTNIYGVPKSIKTDKGSAFISKEFSKYSNENNITRKYGTANLHTGTGLAERTIQEEDDQDDEPSKKKTTDPNYRRGMIFSQTKKPPNTVSTNKYPFSFYEKNYKTNSLGSKFSNKLQTAISGTKHTVTTDKNKVIHRKLIFNPLPFQNNTTPTKRVTARQTTAEQPSCSKSTEPQTTCVYRRKEPPKPNNHENSEDWIRRKDQPRNEKGQFTSPQKNTGNMTDLDLSIVSDDEFNCYNNSEGRPINVNVDDELQIHPKETRLSPETGINHDHIITKPTTPVRRSRRLPFAKKPIN